MASQFYTKLHANQMQLHSALGKKMKLENLSMKVKLCVFVAIFAICNAVSAQPIPPDEMVSMCGSLVTYASIAVQSKQSKIPSIKQGHPLI
jgi:hypothetical protein